MSDGDVSGSDVRNHRRDEKRRNPLWSIIEEFLSFTDLCRETADSRPDIDAEPERIDVSSFLSRTEPGLLHCLCGCCNGKDGESVLFPCKGRLDAELRRVEILHLSCNMDREIICWECRDEVDSTDSVKQILPECFYIVSNRRYDPGSCNNYSSCHN